MAMNVAMGCLAFAALALLGPGTDMGLMLVVVTALLGVGLGVAADWVKANR